MPRFQVLLPSDVTVLDDIMVLFQRTNADASVSRASESPLDPVSSCLALELMCSSLPACSSHQFVPRAAVELVSQLAAELKPLGLYIETVSGDGN
jgi:hypothetical protein